MQVKRILVLGCCGSGKTTLALRLGEITGLPVVHLDRLFWTPGWTMRPREEFDALLARELQKDAWIIDGNYRRTLPTRLQYCDQVICLDMPRLTCVRGVLTRVIKAHGKTRPDMGEGCPERFDRGFVIYTWNFEKTQGADSKELIAESGRPVVRLRSRRAAGKYLKTLEKETAARR